MTRRDIVRLFYDNLCQDCLGEYFVEIGTQRCRVEAEDTAYIVKRVDWSNRGAESECVHLLLSDDTVEELDPTTLRIGRNNILYCKVKNRRFDARFSTSSYYRLAEHAQYDSLRDSFFILINGKTYSFQHSALS